jgi:DNA-directed RNA polymerase subunit K/omega
MSFGYFEDYEPEEEEEGGETPEIEQPELENEFQTDFSELTGPRIRSGAERISPPYLGTLAKARLIAARAAQLWQGSVPLIPVAQLQSRDMEKIARQELNEAIKGKITFPIRIVRKFPDGSIEYWSVSDFKYIARD